MSNRFPRSKTNIETVALDLATLVMIMEYLATNDLLAVMRTCHMLYTAGIQTLVRKNHYVYTDVLPSYRTFMFSHAPASFKAFQELEVDYWAYEEGPTAPLTDVLYRGAAHLRRLYLASDEMPKEIARAVASLTHLQKLIMSDDLEDSERIVYILSNLQSPLTELSTEFQADHKYPILPLLSNFRDTLETLTLRCTTLDDVDIHFSKLTFLDLRTKHPVPLSVLMSAFPNLQELDVGWYNVSVEEQQLLRSQNIAFQQAGHKWTSLRRLKGFLTTLFTLALSHDLDAIIPAISSEELSPQDLHMLQLILSETHPKSLTLSLGKVRVETLQALLLSAGLERTVDLSLNITVDSAEHMEDLSAALLTALAQLSSRIKHLSLRFSYPYVSPYRSRGPVRKIRYSSSQRPACKTQVLRVFEGFQMTTFAGCVKDALPLLEKLSLRIEKRGPPFENATQWVSLVVQYDEGVAPQVAVHSNDDARREIVAGSPTGTVHFS